VRELTVRLRCGGSKYPKGRARSGRGHWEFPRSPRTTQVSNESLGWAEVRHPFHPLKGQRFSVLKTRRVGGTETLILRDPARGSIAVRREWTDWDATTRVEPAMPPRLLALESLLELAKLVDDLRHPAPLEVDR
jgi:hypothetical protein